MKLILNTKEAIKEMSIHLTFHIELKNLYSILYVSINTYMKKIDNQFGIDFWKTVFRTMEIVKF